MSNDEGWGQPTAVYGGGVRPSSAVGTPAAAEPRAGSRPADATHGAGWTPAGPASRAQQRSNRSVERSLAALRERRAPERGLPWWAALLLLIVVAGIGGYIDTSGGALQIQGGFNIGIVVASLIAILVVKRSHMFPIVIAPPIVYTVAAVFSLYLHGGLSNRGAVIDAASNYLVYGFPAIAAASACVLIVGGVRMIIRK